MDVNGRLVFGPPKTHQHRSVPVPRFLRGDLAEQLAGKQWDDLVFTAPRGAVLRVQNFRRTYFDPAAAEVGMAGLVPHELRHTAASLAIAAGATVKAVQAMLGHASATVTLDHYGHLGHDEHEQAIRPRRRGEFGHLRVGQVPSLGPWQPREVDSGSRVPR